MVARYKICVWSSKGGVGKSVIATQLATSAVLKGLKVCFYDLDPQKTASYYLEQLTDKYKPAYIFSDFKKAPPEDTEFIIIDCVPNINFIPPKDFIIVSPTLASTFDLHSFRETIKLEKEGYTVIRVLNQYSMVRNDDEEVAEAIRPCIRLGGNSAIRAAIRKKKTIWNDSTMMTHRARNHFMLIANAIISGGKYDHQTYDEYVLTTIKRNSK